MYDVMTIGTLTVDLYFKSDTLTHDSQRFDLAMGGKYFANHFYQCLGGGATNVAIGLQKKGLHVALKTVIGENGFKKMIIDTLQGESVSHIYSKCVKDHMNISCVLLSETGEKTVINYQSPHQHLFTDEHDYNALLRSRNIYFANAPDVSFYEKAKILSYLKSHDKQTFVNLGVIDCRRSAEQVAQLLDHTDVLIVNGHEFADLVKKPYEKIDFHKHVVQNYLPQYLDRVVIVTDGKKGSYGYHGNKVYRQKPIEPAKIIDSTGAGDGYSAGFIAEFIHSSGDIEAAMLSGAHYASKILGKIGAN